MYKTFFLLPSRMPFLKHGEGNDPAKVAAAATALLTRYGYTTEELAALAEADDVKIGELFTSRFSNIETDVIARKGKPLTDAARVQALKDAHHTTETRVLATLKELGIELGEEEVRGLEEKGRIEALVKIGLERKKEGGANTPEELKDLQKRLEAERKGAGDAQKKATSLEKELADLKASLPGLEDQIEMRYFANQSWRALATKAETLETLTVKEASFLLPFVQGQMMATGHKFIAEKGSNGGKTLLVVDSEGNPIPIAGGAGNHTPETYLNSLYSPLVKKSNADHGGGTSGMPRMEDASKLTGHAKKAYDAMMAQAQGVK